VITKDRMHSFLPGLWEEVFKMSTPPPPLPSTIPSNIEVGCLLLIKSIIDIFIFRVI
jgi:hypothetical protein